MTTGSKPSPTSGEKGVEMLQGRKDPDDEYPLALKIALSDGWIVITEDADRVIIGRGRQRKEWIYEKNSFTSLKSSPINVKLLITGGWRPWIN